MLGLVLAASTLVAAAPAAQIAPGTYTYVATLAGANVGTSTLTVTNVDGTTHINEQLSGSVGGDGAHATDTLTLAPDLTPASYAFNGVSNGSPVKDSASVAGTTANVTNVHGQSQSFDLMASTKHFVIVDLGPFSGFLSLPAQMRAWNDAAVMAVIPSLGRSIALVPSSAAAPARPSTVPQGDQSLSFDGQAPFTIWYNPATNVPDEIDVTSQGLIVQRKS